MKNKPIIIVLSILFILYTCAAIVGFINHKEEKTPVKPEPNLNLVTYEYYIDDVSVQEAPVNDEENKYVYSHSDCDNNMILNFDNENWSFDVKNKSEGVCRLYFNKGTYEVTLTTTNGLITQGETQDTGYIFKVDRLTDGQFVILPNEGYKFKEATCANDKQAIYDESTNTLSINSITEDIACKVDFEVKNLTVEITVKNGEGTTTQNADYGKSISAVVKANEGYEKPKIECTNNQEYTYENNEFSIPKLTDNTKCTVTFNKVPTVTYNLKIEGLPEEVTITSGNTEQSIVSGKDGKFSLKAEDGYTIVLDCNGVQPSDEKVDPDGTITYTFLGITKNITCNVTTSN